MRPLRQVLPAASGQWGINTIQKRFWEVNKLYVCPFNSNMDRYHPKQYESSRIFLYFFLFHQEREASVAGNLPFIWWGVFAHP